jgi:hypothetical protein
MPDRLTDDETPLGDTPEGHDELRPHDLPRDHPARDEVARRAPDARAGASGSA